MNSEVSFSLTSCHPKAEEPSLPYYLPIAGGRIIGFIPFPRVLVLCEMQSFLPRIWTRVAVSISYDDNHYTTGISKDVLLNVFCACLLYLYVRIFWIMALWNLLRLFCIFGMFFLTPDLVYLVVGKPSPSSSWSGIKK